MSDRDGTSFRVERARRVVLDVVHLARSVPSFPVERWCDLGELAEVRSNSPIRVSWLSLFVRAYGLISREVPQLRQSYSRFPFERLYQSPYSAISVSVTRQIAGGGEQLFFGRLRSPETKPLLDIQQEIDLLVNGDVQKVYRQQLQSELVPTLVRRLAWWWRMNVALSKRARRVGTGSISVLASSGVHNRLHPCMLTSSLSYGPVEENGRCWITLQCDHRVIDGVPAARALNGLCDNLRGPVLDELRKITQTGQLRRAS